MRQNKITDFVIIVLILVFVSSFVYGDLSSVTGDFASEGSFVVDDKAPVFDPISEVIASEGDLISISANATDPNGESVTISYGLPLNSSGEWQTGEGDGGIYQVTITATDGTKNSTLNVIIKITPYCGDGICNASKGETCSSCSSDCGTCPTRGGGGASTPDPVPVKEEVVQEPLPEKIVEDVKESIVDIPSQIDQQVQEIRDEQNRIVESSFTVEGLRIDLRLETPDIDVNDNKVRFTLDLVQTLGIVDEDAEVKLTYYIVPIDVEGNAITGRAIKTIKKVNIDYSNTYIYVSDEYVKANYQSITLMKEFNLPEDLPSGKYALVIVADYKGKRAEQLTEFDIRAIEQELAIGGLDASGFRLLLFGLLAIFVVILIYVIICYSTKRKIKNNNLKTISSKSAKKTKRKVKRKSLRKRIKAKIYEKYDKTKQNLEDVVRRLNKK